MLKDVKIHDLEPGMILGETIYNYDGTISLLSNGGVLSLRQIELLRNLGLERVKIEVKNEDEPSSEMISLDKIEVMNLEKVFSDDKSEKITRKSVEAEFPDSDDVDIEQIKKDLRAYDEVDEIIGSKPNQYNNRMSVAVLTGENDIPIDVKHERLLAETKNTFEQVRHSNNLDFEQVKDMISATLPDIIRNNDVLTRLSQLKRTDDYTFEHSYRVSILATMIGKWMGMNRSMLEELATAALLFDIGKMKIPEFILKKGVLTDEEMELMKKHSQFGYSILLKTEGVTPNIKFAALQHHERNGGIGYPLKLNEGQVNGFAKIIMVCDIFDAMTSDRPYAKRISEFKAAEYISWQSGMTLDSKICYIFLSNIAEFFTGKQILLSTGEVGRIVYVDPNFPTRPTVVTDARVIDLINERDIQVIEMIG